MRRISRVRTRAHRPTAARIVRTTASDGGFVGVVGLEYLIRCERCGHGISAHEPAGCSAAGCECRASLHDIVEFELTFTRREIRRQWHRHGEPPPAR